MSMDLEQAKERINELEKQNDELLTACKAASAALRSYQFGNCATELAEEVSNFCDEIIAKVKGNDSGS